MQSMYDRLLAFVQCPGQDMTVSVGSITGGASGVLFTFGRKLWCLWALCAQPMPIHLYHPISLKMQSARVRESAQK
eukprot:4560315-Amphidinium_carterae.2